MQLFPRPARCQLHRNTKPRHWEAFKERSNLGSNRAAEQGWPSGCRNCSQSLAVTMPGHMTSARQQARAASGGYTSSVLLGRCLSHRQGWSADEQSSCSFISRYSRAEQCCFLAVHLADIRQPKAGYLDRPKKNLYRWPKRRQFQKMASQMAKLGPLVARTQSRWPTWQLSSVGDQLP